MAYLSNLIIIYLRLLSIIQLNSLRITTIMRSELSWCRKIKSIKAVQYGLRDKPAPLWIACFFYSGDQVAPDKARRLRAPLSRVHLTRPIPRRVPVPNDQKHQIPDQALKREPCASAHVLHNSQYVRTIVVMLYQI